MMGMAGFFFHGSDGKVYTRNKSTGGGGWTGIVDEALCLLFLALLVSFLLSG